jgi:hypothetical protein
VKIAGLRIFLKGAVAFSPNRTLPAFSMIHRQTVDKFRSILTLKTGSHPTLAAKPESRPSP